MQIVIDIPSDIYSAIVKQYRKDKELQTRDNLYKTIANGTPLPNNHGRLIDADKLKTHFIGTEQGTDLEVYLESTIIDAETIVKADKDGE